MSKDQATYGRETHGTLSRIPMKRFSTEEDIGNAALFLASSGSDYITGEVVLRG